MMPSALDHIMFIEWVNKKKKKNENETKTNWNELLQLHDLNQLNIVLYFFYNYIYIIQTFLVSRISTDERDAIQKKTFTKWVNKHLKKVSA